MSPDKLGGQIALDNTIPQKFAQRRHVYPCTVCTVFNSPACEKCKCDTCQVPEGKCPKCKNMPKTLAQYQIIHGITHAGENWDAADIFTCQRCRQSWKMTWDRTPAYCQCPYCHTVYYVFPFFTGGYKGCLMGARKPGQNYEKHDIFKCTDCQQFFYVRQDQLPGNHRCVCGRTYYCYRSPVTYEGAQPVGEGQKAIKEVKDLFKL
jgi:hypothetical protein